jgi:hypothetical protein
MSEAWDKVQEATQALKEALDKAVHSGSAAAGEAAKETTALTKHVIDSTHHNIDNVIEWCKRQVS